MTADALPGLQSIIPMGTLPDDISQLTEELIHSDLLADFQVKMINEWRDESTAQRNHKRHHAQPLRLRNIPPNMLESLWGRPEFSDLIRRGGMGQMVSSCWLVASRHQVQGWDGALQADLVREHPASAQHCRQTRLVCQTVITSGLVPWRGPAGQTIGSPLAKAKGPVPTKILVPLRCVLATL